MGATLDTAYCIDSFYQCPQDFPSRCFSTPARMTCSAMDYSAIGCYRRDELLSQGMTAYASSEWPNGNHPAWRANDGDLGDMFHSSCNLDGSGPWWGVDLGNMVRAGLAGDESCRLGGCTQLSGPRTTADHCHTSPHHQPGGLLPR